MGSLDRLEIRGTRDVQENPVNPDAVDVLDPQVIKASQWAALVHLDKGVLLEMLDHQDFLDYEEIKEIQVSLEPRDRKDVKEIQDSRETRALQVSLPPLVQEDGRAHQVCQARLVLMVLQDHQAPLDSKVLQDH